MGFVLFGVLMVFFLTVCSWLQSKLEIPGLILTELAFLAIAIAFCLIRKVKLKEVFTFKKPKVREIFGCLLIVIADIPLSLVCIALTTAVFPWSYQEAGDLSGFLYGKMGLVLSVLIIALLPAICEESIHRGAILSCFRGMKKDWVIILIMGLFFGINHFSVLRFLNTALFGILLSYVVVKKNNLLLSMLMHFTNNLFSTLVGYFSSQSGVAETATSQASAALISSSIGSYISLAVASPMLIALGMMLLNPAAPKKKRFIIAGILSGIMFISGTTLTVINASKMMSLNSTVSYEVTAEQLENSTLDFEIDEERTATVIVTLAGAEGDYTVRIDGDKGSTVISAPVPNGKLRYMTNSVQLQPDHYTVTIVAGENAIGENPVFEIVVM